MKTPIEKIHALTLRDTLKWLIAEYRNIDVATRLCADYCITPDEFESLSEAILKRKESKSRLTFVMRSRKNAGGALLAAR